jgi:cytochrome d ubiquinol oxidase subunit I
VFWLKIFAVSFALGVVSGIVMSFQFGTNWAELSTRAGNILGRCSLRGAHGVLPRSDVPRRDAVRLAACLAALHFLATCMVALGTLISTFWIIAANSWMHTPSGYRIVDGCSSRELVGIVFNPSFPVRLAHMTLAAFITTCFVIGGISAVYLLRQRHREAAQLMLKLAICFAAIAVPLQVSSATCTAEGARSSAVKLAAIEGHWETVRGASLILFAWPDRTRETNRYEVSVPKLGSLILTHELDGEVAGLERSRAGGRPPVAPVFFGFRVMVGIGILMLTLSRGPRCNGARRLFESKIAAARLDADDARGFRRVLAGWYTTRSGDSRTSCTACCARRKPRPHRCAAAC